MSELIIWSLSNIRDHGLGLECSKQSVLFLGKFRVTKEKSSNMTNDIS